MKQTLIAIGLVVVLCIIGVSAAVLYLLEPPSNVSATETTPNTQAQVRPEATPQPKPRPIAKETVAKTETTTPPKKSEQKPVQAPPRFTVEMVRELRAEALQRRKAEHVAALEKEQRDHQWKADWALREAADGLFADSYRDTAATNRQACVAGDANGCAALAVLYETGSGTNIDAQLARSLNFVACANTSDAGCLAYASLESLPTQEDVSSHPHIPHFQIRCEEGWGDACAALASEYKYGFGVLERDEERGDMLFKKACEFGSASACKHIGETERSLALYQDACAANDGAACSGAASLLQKSAPDQMYLLQEQGCTLGHAYSCISLSKHLVENGQSDRDQTQATEMLREGCLLGNTSACMKASGRLAKGMGAPADMATAIAMLRAKCGETAHVQEVCARLFELEYGSLDPASDDVAIRIRQTKDVAAVGKACREGDAAACHTLAQQHGSLGTFESAIVSKKLVYKACEMGNDAACLQQLQISGHSEKYTVATGLCEKGVNVACVAQIEYDPALEPDAKYEKVTALCEAGSPRACAVVADVLSQSSWTIRPDVKTDFERAFALRKQACAQGDGLACVFNGRAMDPDIGNDDYDFVTRDEAETIQLYEKSCDLGASYGCNMRAFAAERNGDLDTAIKFAKRRCSMVLRGCSTLNRVLLLQERRLLDVERGVLQAALSDRPQDFFPQTRAAGARAREACLREITQGCIEFGGLIYSNYGGGVDGTVSFDAADRPWGRAAYARACGLGDALGCHIFANTFDGIGAESEPLVALEGHEIACTLGQGMSCAAAGQFHQRGYDVPEDHTIAAKLYMKGCKLGTTYSCQKLSGFYDLEDEELRAEYQLIACVNGGGYACEPLADNFAKGRGGVPKSKDIASLLRKIECEENKECQ